MSYPSALSKLTAALADVDPQLAEGISLLDASWHDGSARDHELTELAAGALLAGARAGLFELASIVDAFKAFAKEFHDRQLDYLRSGSYRATSYEDVNRDVYSNADYMRSVYYPALLLSYVAAPNYRQILRHLDETLAAWREQSTTRVLEVAAGHAFLLLFALRELPSATGVATDISTAAQEIAAGLATATAWGEGRFSYTLTDVLAADNPLPLEFDAAICCELLEHVPEPALFLRAIHARLRPNGRLFVSAAVRMESVDHLTLFESTEAVAKLLDAEGFDVVTDLSIPFVTRRPKDERHRQKLLHSPTLAATFVADCRRRP